MAAVDRQFLTATKSADATVLVARAGAAVARTAVRLLGGTYGRRVVVVAGPGTNGADGRVAAAILGHQGVVAKVFEAATAPERLPACHLVID
ncbi:MAG: NAD(P)H-hydrate epimerase, partial [Pseudonocardiaceae bacterium]